MLARYGASSIIVSLIAGAGACVAGGLFLDTIDAVFCALLAATTLIIAVVDLHRFEIPDPANIAVFLLGLGWSQAWGFDLDALIQAVLRSLVTAGLLLAVRAGYRAVRKIDGLGLGDVKLAGAGAAWLSYPHIALVCLIAVVAAIAVIVARYAVAGERMSAHAAVPFGTFLAPAVWIVWFVQSAGFDWTVGADQWLSAFGSSPFQ